MIVQQLLEMALKSSSQLKSKRLKELITPQNIVANYERVIDALAYKLSIDDINELAADMAGTEVPPDEVKFQYEMMLKKLPKETKAHIDNTVGLLRLTGKLPGIKQQRSYGGSDDGTFWVEYTKGKWKVSFYNRTHYNSAEHKRFDADKSVDALQHLLKVISKGPK